MTNRPSIESLRAIVYGMKEPSTTEEIEALDAALSELAAYREREPKLIERAERAESALDVLQTWYGDHEEREAGCCPEDTRCTDYIGLLLDTLKMVDATVADLRTQRDESERQGDALKELAEKAEAARDQWKRYAEDQRRGWNAAMVSVQTAQTILEMLVDGEEVKEEARRWLKGSAHTDLEAHDARVRREVLEGAAKRALVMLSQSWDPAWGYSDALPGDIQAAILGPAPQPNTANTAITAPRTGEQEETK